MLISFSDPKVGNNIVSNTKNLKYIEYNGYRLERDGEYYKLFCQNTEIYKSKYFTKRIHEFMKQHFDPNQGNLKWEMRGVEL